MCNGCMDDDDTLINLGKRFNKSLSGCSDSEIVKHCDDPHWGHGLGHLCPATCKACICDDDDRNLVHFAIAARINVKVSGCSDVKRHCDDKTWGFGIAHFCLA